MSFHEIQNALALKQFEIIDAEEKANQLRIVGRMPDDDAVFDNWCLVLHRLLSTMQRSDWKLDASKKYEIREADNKLVFMWRLIFEGRQIARLYPQIAQVVKSAPRTNRTEVMKFQLTGSVSGKYSDRVGPMGKIATGAAAKRR